MDWKPESDNKPIFQLMIIDSMQIMSVIIMILVWLRAPFMRLKDLFTSEKLTGFSIVSVAEIMHAV